MAVVGAGFTSGEVNRVLTEYARLCMNVKAKGANIQGWFDAANGATNNGSNVVARAVTLKAKMDDDGSVLTAAEVQDIIKAFDELLYWAATFVPSETLKVCGPSTLI